ncbi:conserved hypothetical protein [Talaromyces stipitatus ATCC 10500]|uniref:MFS multidrug transporter n=1 Tax=Talaromyces stipitatus (strain ATCC 10500 / CBS 375.48 / QM 6759 / NRRL 1006) TaxID=441959 RepID=B8MP73_TALSN|nr:uncharacterized protein TSTA_105240 [Talaromyces stipitatus ATCC 10500]EED14312.1 conserved hypothetical protein [Talaromyces stipitatus ATCC 10500]
MVSANERTPLLDSPPDNDAPEEQPLSARKSFYSIENRRVLYTIASLCLVLFIFDISNYIAVVPQTAIFEEIVCRDYYSSGFSVLGNTSGDKCKIEPIQSEVALISGWRDTFETIPALLVTIPFGALADKIGRKKMALLGAVGCLLSDLWVRTVCLFSDIFPLRFVWFSGAFQLIGGGATTMSSMIYVMAVDVCPPEYRTTSFSQITAAGLASEFLSVQASAWLMSKNPWIPYLGSSLILITGLILIIVLIPETFVPKDESLMDTSTEENLTHTAESPSWIDCSYPRIRQHISNLGPVFRWMRRNVPAMMIISSFFFANIGRQTAGILLQYITQKFHWTFAKAAFVISLRAVGNLFVLAFLLPTLSELISRRTRLAGEVKDKLLSQFSVVTIILGYILIFVADSPLALSIGVILSALVSAFTVTARSILSSLVDQRHLATVYTGLSVMTYSGMVAGGPLLASSFHWGMKFGDPWMGLPFIVAAGLYVVILLVISMARMP